MRTILQFKKGTMDKEYRIILGGTYGGADGGYQVVTKYGRRGGTMNDGNASIGYQSMTDALAFYKHTIQSKKKKGYKVVRTEDGTRSNFRADDFVGCSREEFKRELKHDSMMIKAGATREPGNGDWIVKKSRRKPTSPKRQKQLEDSTIRFLQTELRRLK